MKNTKTRVAHSCRCVNLAIRQASRVYICKSSWPSWRYCGFQPKLCCERTTKLQDEYRPTNFCQCYAHGDRALFHFSWHQCFLYMLVFRFDLWSIRLLCFIRVCVAYAEIRNKVICSFIRILLSYRLFDQRMVIRMVYTWKKIVRIWKWTGVFVAFDRMQVLILKIVKVKLKRCCFRYLSFYWLTKYKLYYFKNVKVKLKKRVECTIILSTRTHILLLKMIKVKLNWLLWKKKLKGRGRMHHCIGCPNRNSTTWIDKSETGLEKGTSSAFLSWLTKRKFYYSKW